MDHLDPPDFEDLRSEPALPAVDAAISDVAAADVVFTEVAVADGAVAETAPTLAPEAVAANGAPADVDSAAPPISWIPATVVVPEIVPDFLASEPAPADVVSEAESVGVFVAEPAPADVLLSERAPADALPAELAAPDIVVSADGASPDSIAAATEDAAAAVAPAPKVDPKAAELRRRAQESWERVVAAKESGEVLTGFVISAVKGGLLVDISGIRGFLPASQARAPEGGALDALVKTKVPLKILDLDTSRRRAVVSQRRALEEDRRTKRAELIRSLAAGQRREGVVVRLVDFGAFVDLGGIDGLIPMSELAFERIEKAADVVAVGERVTVDVLRVDEGGKKISLSRKSALPDPWRDHADVVRTGARVEGKVVGREPRLQVEIAPGVVGSVRDSDANPADYEIGETIEVTVRTVDRRARRILLATTYSAAVAAQPASSSSSGFAPLGVELQRALEAASEAVKPNN